MVDGKKNGWIWVNGWKGEWWMVKGKRLKVNGEWWKVKGEDWMWNENGER